MVWSPLELRAQLAHRWPWGLGLRAPKPLFSFGFSRVWARNLGQPASQNACLGLAGLLVVPCLGLVWPGPVLPALPWPGPATTTGRLRRPAAAAPGLLLLLDEAKARRARQARQGQARASQGKAQQASQPSQTLLLPPLPSLLGWVAGRNFGFFSKLCQKFLI